MLNSFQHPFRLGHGWLLRGRPQPSILLPMDRQPCVYILASQPHGTVYIGMTSDLVARLHQHRTDAAEGFTSRYAVHSLVRFEPFGSMEAAILREKQLKRWHRQWKVNLIESENPQWVDLAVELGLPPLPHRGGHDGC